MLGVYTLTFAMPRELVSDMVSDEETLLPECVINIRTWCSDSLERILNWCDEIFTRISTWSKETYSKYERELIIIFKSISIFMYILDFGTDLFTGIKHFSNNKNTAGSVTIVFSILPMLFLSFKLIIHSSMDSGRSININFIPTISAVVCSPILPLGWMVLDLIANINSDNSVGIIESLKLTADKAAKLVKLFVAVVESFPQATIQLFIVFESLIEGEYIEFWQWGTIAISIISLSLSVSTGYLNAEASSSSKAIYFLFGLLAVVSRQVVCCIYSLHKKVLWLVPFCSQLAISAIIWSLSTRCRGQGSSLLIFVITEAYNNFTLSGLFTSLVYFGFSVGALFFVRVKRESQNVLNELLMVNIILAFVSLAFNFLFTVIPQCKSIRTEWMKKCKEETTQICPERTSNNAMETQPDVELTLYNEPENHLYEGVVINYPQEIQSIAEGRSIHDSHTQSQTKGVLNYAIEIQPEVEITTNDAKSIDNFKEF